MLQQYPMYFEEFFRLSKKGMYAILSVIPLRGLRRFLCTTPRWIYTRPILSLAVCPRRSKILWKSGTMILSKKSNKSLTIHISLIWQNMPPRKTQSESMRFGNLYLRNSQKKIKNFNKRSLSRAHGWVTTNFLD